MKRLVHLTLLATVLVAPALAQNTPDPQMRERAHYDASMAKADTRTKGRLCTTPPKGMA